MHIPASMLHGTVCPVTIAVTAAGVGTAVYWARQQEEKPSAGKFAAVTSLIFAMQMLNFPVQNGTSGHLLGGMLAVALLGVPYSVLSIALVLVVQAVFFGDGGVNALGANILNMGLVGTMGAGFLFEAFQKRGLSKMLALALASWVSVVLASLACSIEVAASGAAGLAKVLPAMVSVHALIGVGEAIITVAVVLALIKVREIWKAQARALTFASFILAVVAAMLSPFASRFPDGLEWVAGRLSFAEFHGFASSVFFTGYQASFIPQASWATIVAALMGLGIVGGVAFLTGRSLSGK